MMTASSLITSPPTSTEHHIRAFLNQFGSAHLNLACHAALSLAFTPELLYGLWVNFQEDCHGSRLNIPWVAVSDLLLSGLCDEVGYQLYEIKRSVRRELLQRLTADPALGPRRVKELAQFLSNYVQVQLRSEDPDIRDFSQAQQWTALAYTQAERAAQQLALALSHAYQEDRPDLLRIALIVEALEDPLADFPQLLAYARGMAHLARGDIDAAKAEFDRMNVPGNRLDINGIKLSIPTKTERYTEPLQPPKLKLTMSSPYWWTAISLSMLAWGNVVWVMRPQVEEARRFDIAMPNPKIEIPEIVPPDEASPDIDDSFEEPPISPPPIARPTNPFEEDITELSPEPGSARETNPSSPSPPSENTPTTSPESIAEQGTPPITPPGESASGSGEIPLPRPGGSSSTIIPGSSDNPQPQDPPQDLAQPTAADLQEMQQQLQQAYQTAQRGTVSALVEAVRLAQQVPDSSPQKGEANQALTRWSWDILLLAEVEAATNLPGAIAIAELIPTQTEAYAQAQLRAREWRAALGGSTNGL